LLPGEDDSSKRLARKEVNITKSSVYFAAKMPTATAWLELLCRQSEAWQKRSKNKR